MKSYDYTHRKGARYISWDEFAAMSRELARLLSGRNVEAVVGIARAGLFPAVTIACALRLDLHPARLTRRERDEIEHERPVWKVPVSPEVSGRVVAVVDEIADTGETLAMAAAAAKEAGAKEVLTAALVSHSWAMPMPDAVALISDELIIFPWDQQVLVGTEWQMHPEIVAALAAQERKAPERKT